MKKILFIIILFLFVMLNCITAQIVIPIVVPQQDSMLQEIALPQDSIEPPKVAKDKIPKPPMVNREVRAKRGFSIDIMGNVGGSNVALNDVNWNYGVNRGISNGGIEGSQGMSWGGGVELNYYFTGKLGIGIGAHFNDLNGGLEIRGFEARYYSDYYNVDGDYWDYERRVSTEQLAENYALTQVSFPVLLKFKTDVSYRFGVFAHVGAMYNLPLQTSTTIGEGTIDYEAVYYSNDGTTYGYGDGELNEYTLQLTEEYFFTLSQDATADELHLNNHFDQETLNIGLGIRPRNVEEGPEIAPYFSILGRLGVMYNISEKISLLLSGQYVYGLPFEGDSYILVDKIIGEGNNKYGEYHSLLNGGARYSTFGANLGLSIRF